MILYIQFTIDRKFNKIFGAEMQYFFKFSKWLQITTFIYKGGSM